jgi:homoserine O-acetyltransferase
MGKHTYISDQPFQLEFDGTLPNVEICYHTYGELNAAKDNVVWVCHALTANSDAADWWEGLVGSNKVIDPSTHYIVCANIIGSCYGSSGPLTINPETGAPYYSDFPQVTIRDMVKAHLLLKTHLGIEKIHIGLGGSMGGYQLLEWTLMEENVFEHLVLTVTGAQESAWGKAIHATQRMAIESDPSWKDHTPEAGKNGMMTARGIGMLTYRNYDMYVRTQTDESFELGNYRADSYIRYQGEKLAKRFHAFTYWLLAHAMDSHDISRDRGTLEETLGSVNAKTLIIGVTSDILCPVQEQQKLEKNMPNATFKAIDSPYGHDGFLIEFEQISNAILAFLKEK